MFTGKNLILATLISALPLSGYAQDIEYAKQCILNERYNSAEEILEKNITTESPEPEVSYLLVKTYLIQDKINEAKSFVQNHLQTSDYENESPLNGITYARYLLNSGNKKMADGIFSDILNNKKNSHDPALLKAMAEVYINEDEGDATLAINWLTEAEKRSRKDPDIDILKGLAYKKLMDASNAYSSFEGALKKDPRNVKAHYLIGKIFTAQNNADVYLEHFLKAYQIDSTYAPVLEGLYEYYYYRDIRLAKKYLEKYIANSDYSIANDYNLTDVLYLAGEYRNAIESAKLILKKQADKSEPRLYKLIAYSLAKSGDSAQALQSINDYFAKEGPPKIIAADYELRAQLTERDTGRAKEAITYYIKAFEMDTLTADKLKFASKITAFYKTTEDYHNEALWLGTLYALKNRSSNIDLFNWGIAHYNAGEYVPADSVFLIYTTRYPDDIYGYYWRAQVNAAIDTNMSSGMAIPYFIKTAELGEKNAEKYKKMLLKTFGYLAGYEANIMKEYEKSLAWLEKYLELDHDNTAIKNYAEKLKKWISQKK